MFYILMLIILYKNVFHFTFVLAEKKIVFLNFVKMSFLFYSLILELIFDEIIHYSYTN